MTATKTREEILSSLNWSPAKEVATKKGPRLVTSAPLTQAFADIWDTERDELYKLGYSVSYFRGAWQVAKWSELPKAVVVKREESKALSRATDADVEVPRPEGLEYLPFQRAGIAFALRVFGDIK